MPPPNRLQHEASLYLRQHAHNPVDWHPWGPEAIAEATRRDCPIFLSIGYSACHWCHVMEHESFEDETTAGQMNRDFVCIKVDREERPDLDAIYMAALQAMTREGGGWPLSVWLTPDLHPFYAGTYFPPDDRYGGQRPSFRRLLDGITHAWRDRRAEIVQQSQGVIQYLNAADPTETGDTPALAPEILDSAIRDLQKRFDPRDGGFGRAPKFPHAVELLLLNRLADSRESPLARQMADFSLRKMAQGGIYDQVGGGYARYSVDARWLVPHFEKMLYDNALLLSAHAELHQATGDPFHARICREIAAYLGREMTSPAGLLYSTQDADSEGEEGKFYVWSQAEVAAALTPAEAEPVCLVFDITRGGNFEGHNIPHLEQSVEEWAVQLHRDPSDLQASLRTALDKLFAIRDIRVKPGRDEKYVAAWNGMAVEALARASMALGEPTYLAMAVRAAEGVLRELRLPDGRPGHSAAAGVPCKIPAFLDDLGCVGTGLLALFQADSDPRWLEAAIEFGEVILKHHADPAGAGFFYAPDDHEALIVRTKDSYDGSTPSGNAAAATLFVRLARLTDREDFRQAAERTLKGFATLMQSSPGAAGQMLVALDGYLADDAEEWVIVGGAPGEEREQFRRDLLRRWAPHRLVLMPEESRPVGAELSPLMAGKLAVEGKATLYACKGRSCRAPVAGGYGELLGLA